MVNAKLALRFKFNQNKCGSNAVVLSVIIILVYFNNSYGVLLGCDILNIHLVLC